MTLFNVYPLYDIEPVKAQGSYLWDKNGQEYLDLYGGHAVISVGHTHPYYVRKITQQLKNIGFYSNSVKIPSQEELADKLGKLSCTVDGCKKRDEMVFEQCLKHQIPVQVSMGGGYSPEIKTIVEAHANTFRIAKDLFS